MNFSINKDILAAKIEKGEFNKYPKENIIILYSAAITLADDKFLADILKLGQKLNLSRSFFYEIVLQSYLFLGFPRMLIAAENLNKIYPVEENSPVFEKISESEASDWFENGTNLCLRVYKDMYEPLKENVMSIAPEIFRWMVIEGYGKVLSRDGLDIKERELSIIAFLMMENRPKQLFSHIKGALNVGLDKELLKQIVNEIGEISGDGYDSACEILKQLRIS